METIKYAKALLCINDERYEIINLWGDYKNKAMRKCIIGNFVFNRVSQNNQDKVVQEACLHNGYFCWLNEEDDEIFYLDKLKIRKSEKWYNGRIVFRWEFYTTSHPKLLFDKEKSKDCNNDELVIIGY